MTVGELRSGWPAPEDPDGSCGEELAGRELIAERAESDERTLVRWHGAPLSLDRRSRPTPWVRVPTHPDLRYPQDRHARVVGSKSPVGGVSRQGSEALHGVGRPTPRSASTRSGSRPGLDARSFPPLGWSTSAVGACDDIQHSESQDMRVRCDLVVPLGLTTGTLTESQVSTSRMRPICSRRSSITSFRCCHRTKRATTSSGRREAGTDEPANLATACLMATRSSRDEATRTRPPTSSPLCKHAECAADQGGAQSARRLPFLACRTSRIARTAGPVSRARATARSIVMWEWESRSRA
jgi:hypothetical protein